MRMAVKCTDDETVAFSWITWPDKAARDTGMGKAMADMQEKMKEFQKKMKDPWLMKWEYE